jgi:hypothetical protein
MDKVKRIDRSNKVPSSKTFRDELHRPVQTQIMPTLFTADFFITIDFYTMI